VNFVARHGLRRDPPPDSNLDDQEKNYFRRLIKEGLDIDQMAVREEHGHSLSRSKAEGQC